MSAVNKLCILERWVKELRKPEIKTKLEQVLYKCADIQCDCNPAFYKKAEPKFIELLGIVVKGTQYEKIVNETVQVYLDAWERDMTKAGRDDD